MTTDNIKDRQYAILLKVRDVCLKENIKMFLCGETALAVCRDFSLNDDITVAIHAYDANRFIKAMENADESIVVESMLNNNKYPYFDLRVCDKNTTDFDVNYYGKIENHCLHINVKFIETIPSISFRFLMLRAKFKEYANDVRSDAKNRDYSSTASLFRKMIRCASKKPNYNKSFCKIVGKKFPASVFERSDYVELDGEKLPVPVDLEGYFENEFGLAWRFHECAEYMEASGFFRTVDFTWEDYSKAIEDVDFDRYVEQNKEYKRISKNFNKEHKKVLHCYHVLERTFDRIYLWQKYMPMKSELIAMYEGGKFDELKEELEEYYKFLDKHEQKELGLCFDREILDIALELIKRDGHEEYAARLLSLVPERHFEEIKIKDYKGEIIE